MTFSVLIHEDASKALHKLSIDDFGTCSSKILALGINPYPGVGGDKEKLDGKKNLYRIHISRTYTALYQINKKDKTVFVTFFGTIKEAHKQY